MAEINVRLGKRIRHPVLKTVKMYLKKGGEFDLDQDRKKIEKERKDAEKEVLGKIVRRQKGLVLHAHESCTELQPIQ